MNAQPDDTDARRAELALWAEERQRASDSGTGRSRMSTRLAERVFGPQRLTRTLFRADYLLDRIADRVFGRGLETSGRITLPEHELDDRVGYVPTAWHVVPRALRYIGVSDRDTFIDFGCGKGRVVHQAARYPFRQVIGVEVIPELAEIARATIATRKHRYKCQDVQIVVADATQYQVPDHLTVAYFFRPFGDEGLSEVLQEIVASIDRNPRRVRVIYVWPMGSSTTVLATGRFRLVKEQRSSLIHRRKDHVAIFESC